MVYETPVSPERYTPPELLTEAVEELRTSPRFKQNTKKSAEYAETDEGIVRTTSIDGLEVDGTPVTLDYRQHRSGSYTYFISAPRPVGLTDEIDDRWSITLNPFDKRIMAAQGVKGYSVVNLSNSLIQDLAHRLHALAQGESW